MVVMEMSLVKVWDKLRKNNKAQYRQFRLCIGIAVMLITSYLMMLMSPLIQQTLPDGGDSRKQVYMIFVLAAAGCVIFVIYAIGLFLRYKSREVGVFLALGADKKRIGRALISEIGKCSGITALLGLAGGSVLAWLIGTVFRQVMSETTDASFAFTISGFLASILYAAVLLVLLMILTWRFMRRSNIMDILNEQRKQEPLKKIVSGRTLISGLILLVGGVLLGFVMPVVVANMTKHYLGAWTNLFYLAALAGLYQILVYSISCHKKGRNPKKYYKNLISYGMLKFQGRSIVRNMLVITLLLLGGLFAAFYTPVNSVTGQNSLQSYESMYGYFYTQDAGVPSEQDVKRLASEYGVTIKNYRSAQLIQAVGSGVNRDDVDENGNLKEIYEKRHRVYEFVRASDYERLTGQRVKVERGTYRMIQGADAEENLFFRFDDMDQVYLDQEDRFLPMEYAGNLTYQSLVQGRGFDNEARYVVNDRDYRVIAEGTAQFPRETQVFFDSRGGDDLAFSEELYRQFGELMAEDMKVCGAYDGWENLQEGEDYSYAGMAVYDPQNPVLAADWQYEPMFLPLEEAYSLASYAVYLLLFLYVAAVCLAAACIVGYARSQSVGLSSAQVFADLRRLGADRKYLRRLLKQQIQKVYVLPTIIGCGGIWLFELLLMKMNDGRMTGAEAETLLLCGGIALAAAALQYLLYRFSLRKVEGMLELKG